MTLVKEGQNASDVNTRQLEQEYHSLPADWAARGRHVTIPDTHERFWAEAVCHEYRFETWPEASNRSGARETHELYVLYRNPETGEYVEREYTASVRKSNDETVRVWSSNADTRDERIEFTALPVSFIDRSVILPTIVADGEPLNFPVSIPVHPEEPRIDVGNEGGDA